MGVVTTSRSEVDRLVGLPLLRRRLSIDDLSRDTELLDILEEVSSLAAQEADRELLRATFVETGPRVTGRSLVLAHAPVEASSVAVTLSGETLVAGTDFEVDDAEAGTLWRSGVWWPSGGNPTDLSITYRAGYFPASSRRRWLATAAYRVGDWVAPGGQRYVFECTAAGVSGATAPSWSTPAVGDTLVDSGVTWTARDGYAPPAMLQTAVIAAANWLYRTRVLEAGTTKVEAEGHKRTFASQTREIPDQLIGAFRRLRLS